MTSITRLETGAKGRAAGSLHKTAVWRLALENKNVHSSTIMNGTILIKLRQFGRRKTKLKLKNHHYVQSIERETIDKK